MARYIYKIVPLSEPGIEAVEAQTLVSEDEFAVGDVLPVAPGTWTVERVGSAGLTQWASEAVGRVDPQTMRSLTLYCRVDA
jgi:hypothetical protein